MFPKGITYRYPNGLNLRPDSEAHGKLLAAIQKRLLMSQRRMQGAYGRWRRMDDILTTYVPMQEEEKKAKENDFNAPVSIVMPTSYATLEVMLTYLLKAFATTPIFRYDGVSPDDTKGALLMEEIVQKQAIQSSMILDLYDVSLLYCVRYWTTDSSVGYGGRLRISEPSAI